jgi:hypothetical protein
MGLEAFGFTQVLWRGSGGKCREGRFLGRYYDSVGAVIYATEVASSFRRIALPVRSKIDLR